MSVENKTIKSDKFFHALMLVAIVLASTSFPIGAFLADKLDPVILMFLRFILAAFMFLPLMAYKHGVAMPSKKSLIGYSLLGIPLAIFFWAMFEALRYTTQLNTSAIYTAVPAITAVFAFFINSEVTERKRALALSICTVGALWIVFRGEWNLFVGAELNYGDLIFLFGCVVLGLYNPMVKRFHSGEPTIVMTFWVLLSGSLWLLIASVGEMSKVNWSGVGVDVYISVLYLSFFTTLVTFFLINYCTMKIGATKVASYGFLTPFFVIIFSVSLGMESFEPQVVPGLVLVLVGMVVIQVGELKYGKV